MGLLDDLGGMLGKQAGGTGGGGAAQQILGRLMGGQSNVADHTSDDARGFHQMLGRANPSDLQSVFSHAARQVNPQEYHDHITPGVGGTNPLGGLGQGALGMIATTLLSHLGRGGAGGMGGGGGMNLASLLGAIPGLQNRDPNHMNEHDVAALAAYARRNDPDAFGAAAADVGRQQPGLLQNLLGNSALQSAAMGLASKFLGGRGS